MIPARGDRPGCAPMITGSSVLLNLLESSFCQSPLGSVKAEMRGVGSARENALCIVRLPPANSPGVRGWPPWLRVHLEPKVSSLCRLINVWSTRKHLSSATMSLSRVILTRTTEFLIMTPGLCSNAYIY